MLSCKRRGPGTGPRSVGLRKRLPVEPTLVAGVQDGRFVSLPGSSTSLADPGLPGCRPCGPWWLVPFRRMKRTLPEAASIPPGPERFSLTGPFLLSCTPFPLTFLPQDLAHICYEPVRTLKEAGLKIALVMSGAGHPLAEKQLPGRPGQWAGLPVTVPLPWGSG